MVYLHLLILWCLYFVFDKFIIRILHHSHSLLDSRLFCCCCVCHAPSVVGSRKDASAEEVKYTHQLKKSNRVHYIYNTVAVIIKTNIAANAWIFPSCENECNNWPATRKEYCFNLLFHLNLHYMNILKKLLQS